MSEKKSGFVGLLGPTNAGKSSLLNALVGGKVSIVSPRTQTTYHRVCGVASGEFGQMVLVDTPGYQKFPEKVARLLNRVADRGGSGCDVFVWVFDSTRDVIRSFQNLETKIRQFAPPEKSICVLNKVDLIKQKGEILPLIQELAATKLFSDIVPLSVLKGDGIELLTNLLIERLPEGPEHFPADQITDRSQQFLVSEYVRESVYRSTHQELPYACRVEIENWDETKNVPVILATIHVDSPSQKKIIIGKGGEKLKDIGIKARRSTESLLGRKVCLKLHVDVEKDWRQDKNVIQQYLELN